jgi:hypothetical protein
VKISRVRPTGRFLAGAGLLFIAALTLAPVPEQEPAARLTPWWCLVCGDYGGVDVTHNVLLFVPFALGLRVTGLRVKTIVAVGALLSLSIELLQWTVVPGRDASLSDVLTNTLGSWLGALIGTHYRALLHPGPARARQLAALGGVLWLATQLATAILLQPWASGDELRGVWARSVYGRSSFDGQIVSAALSGYPLPGDSQPVLPEAARLIRGGRFDLELRILAGHRRRWLPIVEVLGAAGPAVAVEANGADLAFQPPTRSSRLRLRRPSLRLPGALPAEPGAELTLVAQDRRSTLQASWSTAGVQHRASQSLSPSFGWSLLTPVRYAYGPETPLVTMIWVVALVFPVGYWTAHVPGRPFLRWTAWLLLLVAGLGLIPRLTGYQPVHWSEWLAGLAGLAGGAAAHRCATYFEKRCNSLSIKESC